MNSGGDSGLALALPITLGLILLMMIFIVIVFVFLVKRKRYVLDKWDFRKTSKNKKENAESNMKVQTISNKSNNHQQQQQEVRLFPTKDVPTRIRCGLLQAGDVYYEEESTYQAGKISREAVDLMSHWVESCGRVDGGHGTIYDPVDVGRPKSEPIRMEAYPFSKHIYEANKKEKSEIDEVDEVDVKTKTTSSEVIKQLPSLPSTDSNSDPSKNNRKTFVAMYSLTSSSQAELNLFANDVIYYLGEMKKGWLKGEKKDSGEIGWFPRSHVREGMNQAPDTSMFVSDPTDDDEFDEDGDDDDADADDDASIFECVVKHEYEATYDGDLPLKEGEVVVVRETLENGWWRGESGGRSGFFPGSYVQIYDNNSLVTRSCLNLTDEQKNFSISGKRNFPGKQFIQKLSTINLGTLKKVRPKIKMRRESVMVMDRMPAPLPCQGSNDETNNRNWQNPAISYRDTAKTCSNSDLVSTPNTDPIYGNEYSADGSIYEEYAPAKLGSSRKEAIRVKQKILDAVQQTNTHSTALNGKNKISLNFQKNSTIVPPSLSHGHCSTASLRALENSRLDNQQSRLSINFGEELQSRVNKRMKADK